MVIKYLECPIIIGHSKYLITMDNSQTHCPFLQLPFLPVYSSYQTLNVYTKEGQMQERHSLT